MEEEDKVIAKVDALVRASEQRILQAIKVTIEASARAERQRLNMMFAQVEALISLRDALRLEHPLPPTRGWAASPDLLLLIVRHIEATKPRLVVELGSGVSTIVIAASLRRSGSGRSVSLEHDPDHAARTRTELDRQGLSSLADVVHAPLRDLSVGEGTWRWYGAPRDAIPQCIDLVFVDGPPGTTGPLARYPALPVLFDRLAPGASIILDDGARPDEREIVARWQSEYPGFDGRELPLEKGAWVLTRQL